MRATAAAVTADLLLLLLHVTRSVSLETYLGIKYQETPRCDSNFSNSMLPVFSLRTTEGHGCVQSGEDLRELIDTGFIPNAENIFIVHDQDSNAWHPWIQAAQHLLSEKSRCNVFSVQWNRSIHVEGKIATFHHQIVRHTNSTFTKSHFIGYKDGARVAVAAAAKFKFYQSRHGENSGVQFIFRVTALDPRDLKRIVNYKRVFESTRQTKLFDIIWAAPGFEFADYPVKTLQAVQFLPNGGFNPFIVRAVDIFLHSICHPSRWIAKPCESFYKFRTGGCGVCQNDCITVGYDIRLLQDKSDPSDALSGRSDVANRKYYSIIPDKDWAKGILETRMVLIKIQVRPVSIGRFSALLRHRDSRTNTTDCKMVADLTGLQYPEFTRMILISDWATDYELEVSRPINIRERGNFTRVSVIIVDFRTGRVQPFCNLQPPSDRFFRLLNEC